MVGAISEVFCIHSKEMAYGLTVRNEISNLL